MVKLNKHARMRARQRVRGESYAVVASDYGVSPLREGGGSDRQACPVSKMVQLSFVAALHCCSGHGLRESPLACSIPRSGQHFDTIRETLFTRPAVDMPWLEVSPAGLWKALKTTEKDREKIGETRGRKPALTEAQAGRGLQQKQQTA